MSMLRGGTPPSWRPKSSTSVLPTSWSSRFVSCGHRNDAPVPRRGRLAGIHPAPRSDPQAPPTRSDNKSRQIQTKALWKMADGVDRGLVSKITGQDVAGAISDAPFRQQGPGESCWPGLRDVGCDIGPNSRKAHLWVEG